MEQPTRSVGNGPGVALEWSAEDRAILTAVEPALILGSALKEWWEKLDARGGYSNPFDLVRTFNRPDSSFGFFDRVRLDSGLFPVMGTVEEMLYDQPKGAAGERSRRELREFVLRYFLRVSDFRQPEVYAEPRQTLEPPLWQALSWCPRPQVERGGFGYSQHYYKLRGSGVVGKFSREEEFAIVDLREVQEKYEWIVLKVRIFDFNLTFTLPGPAPLRLVVPLEEESYLVLSPDFIVDEERPGARVAGRYGFGYAFVKSPAGPDPIAYGPGHFDAAFKLIQFDRLDGGETRVRMAFVANRPERVLNFSFAPVDWGFGLADLLSFGWTSRAFAPVKSALDRLPLRLGGFDPVNAYVALANLLSGGGAAQDLCISKEQLEKDFLVQHIKQHYQMIVGSLLTWRQIPDWLDTGGLPDWVRTGLSS